MASRISRIKLFFLRIPSIPFVPLPDAPACQNNIPPDRQEDFLQEVKSDTRTKTFIEKYDKLYVVELDALLAFVADEFKSIVQGSVDQFLDQGIYQDVLSHHQPELVDRPVRERVGFI